MSKLRRSYKQFYDTLDTIAPAKKVSIPFSNYRFTGADGELYGKKGKTFKARYFFGQQFRSKKAIVDFVKTFPQLEDGSEDYARLFKEYSERGANIWDMGLVMWIGALKNNDYPMADKIREYANSQGVTLSRFKGNVFMRSV